MVFYTPVCFFFQQQILITSAKPILCGGCGDGCCGGLPLGCGSLNGGFIGGGYRCGPHITPPISFLPVPQSLPIRIPAPRPQSVTIPNIIVALLPPNQNRVIRPRPICGPRPLVLPIPQPYSLPIRSECDSDCLPGPVCGGGIGCGC